MTRTTLRLPHQTDDIFLTDGGTETWLMYKRGFELPEFSARGGSSWQSAMRGTGNIEVDFLNGEIAQLGRRYGVATPANDACQRLAWQLSYSKAKPGSVPVSQVLKAIEQAS